MKRLLVTTDLIPGHHRSASDPATGPARVALVEDGQLVEYHEESGDGQILGNVYLARVVNVEPAIQAAFLDIGESKSAFMHVSDLHPAYRDAEGIPSPEALAEESGPRSGEDRPRIQDLLRRGQPVLVQVTKEAIGHKGPSVTSFLSVPGRFLVLMVGMARAGVSKKIADDAQRERLREIAAQFKVEHGLGVIVRTAGEGRTRRELERDLRYVEKIWKEIVRRSRSEEPPALLYGESDLVIRTVRDLFGTDVDEIVVDDAGIRDRIETFLELTLGKNAPAVRVHEGRKSLFDPLESQVQSLYDRKVQLPSGGTLVIDETEALVAIDVNSAKSRDQEDLEGTAVLTNTEAAVEIARQLRLRDIGGVVVCDFIDMLDAQNRRQVETTLRDALRGDRSKTWIARMSRFGLIEMTRQRLRPSKDKVGRRPCPTCNGRGTIRSPHLLAESIFRQLRSRIFDRKISGAEVWAGAHLLEYLANDARDDLIEIEDAADKDVTLHLGNDLATDAYELHFID